MFCNEENTVVVDEIVDLVAGNYVLIGVLLMRGVGNWQSDEIENVAIEDGEEV